MRRSRNTPKLALAHFVGLFIFIAPPVFDAQTARGSRPRKKPCSSLEYLVAVRIPPIWPPETRMRVNGDVTVKVTLDRRGKLVSARAVCGHPLKISSAVFAVSKWKFRPCLVDGKARKVSGIVTVRFPAETSEPTVRKSDNKSEFRGSPSALRHT